MSGPDPNDPSVVNVSQLRGDYGATAGITLLHARPSATPR